MVWFAISLVLFWAVYDWPVYSPYLTRWAMKIPTVRHWFSAPETTWEQRKRAWGK